MLVGGTALAGFYAGHRRSDDIGLFVQDELSFAEAKLTVASLDQLGAVLTQQHSSLHFLMCLASARVSREACDFALAGGPSKDSIFETISLFKTELEHAFANYLEELPVPPLGLALRQIKKRR